MNKITALKKKQAQLEKLQKEVEVLAKSKDVQQEIAFVQDIERVLKKHSKSVADIVRLMSTKGPAASKAKAAPSRKRKQRKLKVYINPNTKEKVETRGGNHNVLKAWKAEHGAEVVEGWLQN